MCLQEDGEPETEGNNSNNESNIEANKESNIESNKEKQPEKVRKSKFNQFGVVPLLSFICGD